MKECASSKTHGQSSGLYEDGFLCINGNIDSTTLYAFEEDMVPRKVHTLYLNSGGGTKYGGYALRDVVIERPNMKIVVADDMRCVSNCVLLLNKKNPVSIAPNAIIAVHYVFVVSQNDGEPSLTFHKDYSEKYFHTIANGDTSLYEDYKQFLIKNEIFLEEDVISNDNFEWNGSVWLNEEKTVSITQANLMHLNIEQLQRYNVID